MKENKNFIEMISKADVPGNTTLEKVILYLCNIQLIEDSMLREDIYNEVKEIYKDSSIQPPTKEEVKTAVDSINKQELFSYLDFENFDIKEYTKRLIMFS